MNERKLVRLKRWTSNDECEEVLLEVDGRFLEELQAFRDKNDSPTIAVVRMSVNVLLDTHRLDRANPEHRKQAASLALEDLGTRAEIPTWELTAF